MTLREDVSDELADVRRYEADAHRDSAVKPAEEQTKQAQEVTKQVEQHAKAQTRDAEEKTKQIAFDNLTRLGFGGTLSAVACISLAGSPVTLGTVLVAIAGIFGGKPLIEAIKKKAE